MKTLLISLIIFSSLGAIGREDRFNRLGEGVDRGLTDEQVAQLYPWARNAKNSLEEALEISQNFPIEEKALFLSQQIEDVVFESVSNSQLLMRYILNRGLMFYGIIKENSHPNSLSALQASSMLLTASIHLALDYYQHDLDYLRARTRLNFEGFAKFGNRYASMIFWLNESIIDAGAQYLVGRAALEILQWDYYRDLNREHYAMQIVTIQNALKLLPSSADLPSSDFLKLTRQVRKTFHQSRL